MGKGKNQKTSQRVPCEAQLWPWLLSASVSVVRLQPRCERDQGCRGSRRTGVFLYLLQVWPQPRDCQYAGGHLISPYSLSPQRYKYTENVRFLIVLTDSCTLGDCGRWHSSCPLRPHPDQSSTHRCLPLDDSQCQTGAFETTDICTCHWNSLSGPQRGQNYTI